MIKNVVFYHHFNNGDLFAVKYFLKKIKESLPGMNYYYIHYNDPALVRDLEMNHLDLRNYPQLNVNVPFSVSEDTLFINTWIGNYIDDNNRTNWSTYHKMFSIVFEYISYIMNIDLKIGDVWQYVPEIDYSYYECPVNFQSDYENQILFSNGPVRSFQSSIPDNNTDRILIKLLERYTNKSFILTHRTVIQSDRIIYAGDIINANGSDLNEISWIADNSCKYLIGRNSGPFTYMHTKNVLSNRNKKIISFGNNPMDCIVYGIDGVEADYHYFDDGNENILIENIFNTWKE